MSTFFFFIDFLSKQKFAYIQLHTKQAVMIFCKFLFLYSIHKESNSIFETSLNRNETNTFLQTCNNIDM